MKGGVGMSLHEKGRNKKMPTPRHKVTHNHIPTSLFCFNMLFLCLFVMNALGKQTAQHLDIQLPAKYVMLWSWKKQRCRDGVMSDFMSCCRHLLVPSFFHEVTSLHPPSFHRNDFIPHIFLLGQSPNKNASREHVYTRYACACACGQHPPS